MLVFSYIFYTTKKEKQAAHQKAEIKNTSSHTDLVISSEIKLLPDSKIVRKNNDLTIDNQTNNKKNTTQLIPKYTTAILNLELPKTLKNEEIIAHNGFQLVYSEIHEQAKWVCYQFIKSETIKIANRSDNFREDLKIKTKSANSNDYKKSGYDRGHLAPAADMSWSENAMSCSFYYSNMSPQTPSFNRGIWKKLEGKVRDWVTIYDTLYVVTGPVLEDNLPFIGANKVSVPNYYFKVILNAKNNRTEAIGFVLPNAKSSFPIQHYAVTVDSVEKLTGIDFFYQLPDVTETKIESKICSPCWK